VTGAPNGAPGDEARGDTGALASPYLADVLNALSQQLVILDGEGRIVLSNSAWQHFRREHRLPSDQCRGRLYLDVCREDHKVSGDALDRMQRGLNGVLSGNLSHFRFEYPHRVAGRTRWFSMTTTPLPHGPSGAVVTQFDITRQRQTEGELFDLANHDPLTSLANRRSFVLEGTQMLELAKRREWRTTVVFVDLDAFKRVNDDLGHDAGDVALRKIGSRLKGETRSSDLVARFGGDEFVMLLNDVTPEATVQLVERYRAALAQPLDVLGRPVTLRGSFGTATYPDDGGDLEALLAKADSAMYREKAKDGTGHVRSITINGVVVKGRARRPKTSDEGGAAETS
jgi:diguanylate cyclase (GGDEF)-like protein